MNRKLQPIKDSWKKKGVSICSDGWLDRQQRPLINIMATSVGGAMFVKAIDASGNIKDADYVANILVIEEIGKQNIVQIVTDNGSNFKAAGLTIENKYPHIFWTPCVVRSLNLGLKRDGKNPVDAQAREMKQLIVNDVWWDDLDYLLSFTELIVDMLRATDTDAPVLHSIYDMKRRIRHILLQDKVEYVIDIDLPDPPPENC
ncbi:hypothetical protein ACSBR2_007615 [Camellia fascicularis]